MISQASELRSRLEAALQPRIPRALTPAQRSAPEMVPTGIASVDSFTGGVPLGCLTEICGPASSGRTSVLLALIAECMRRDEICALVDASDAFDPQSAAGAGVDLARLLWVRCRKESGHRVVRSSVEAKSFHQRNGPPTRVTSTVVGVRSPDSSKSAETSQLEQSLKATDLLLQAGGFGLVVLDLCDISLTAARRIPLTTWFRFRRAVENTATAFVVVEQQPHAKSCASLVMEFTTRHANWSEAAEQDGTIVGTHFAERIAPSFRVTAEGVAIPFDKPVASSFEMPQRWNAPRLLNTVHVHLQVTRSRGMSAQKLPARPTPATGNFINHSTDARRKAIM